MQAGCKLDEAGFNQSSTSTTTTGTTNSQLIGMWFIKLTIQKDAIIGTTTNVSFTANDYFLFNSDNTVKVSYSNPAVVATGTYSYNATNKTLTMGNHDDTDTYTVNKLTADSLIITTTITATAGTSTTTGTLTYKLTH
jgi:hypothetical protein